MQIDTEEKQYYFVKFVYRDQIYYCVWYTDDIDGLVLREDKLLYFKDLDSIIFYCRENEIKIYDETDAAEYNMDKLKECMDKKTAVIDCKFMLDSWNIISDMSKSADKQFLGDDDETLQIYEKLFYGNNLPCINNSGKKYIPNWSREELEVIYKVIGQGLCIFESLI